MTTKIALRPTPFAAPTATTISPKTQLLLREAMGMSLRAHRADKGMTLRELAEHARVSPGYLSELERGRKEVSSELLASVCHALEASVADVLIEAASIMTMPSVDEEMASTAPAAAE
ncbi:MAG TPA: helix-turn-helix transcriptional regulator [Corynebacterium sp.]|nr:helix-turn-helix transcriptional regulator [Corynebacterium sp.]